MAQVCLASLLHMGLTFGQHGSLPTMPASQFAGPGESSLMQWCCALASSSPGEFRVYLQSLARSGRFQELQAIWDSDLPFRGWAIEEWMKTISPSHAVPFCRGFQVGSSNWMAATMALRFHPKCWVSNYLKECASSPHPLARYACYKTCFIMGWDDLIAEAMVDLNNQTGLSLPNNDSEASLGQMAERYLRKVRHQSHYRSDPFPFPPLIPAR
jgi:hypothetical protein